jgi:outer membrane protein TolC
VLIKVNRFSIAISAGTIIAFAYTGTANAQKKDSVAPSDRTAQISAQKKPTDKYPLVVEVVDNTKETPLAVAPPSPTPQIARPPEQKKQTESSNSDLVVEVVDLTKQTPAIENLTQENQPQPLVAEENSKIDSETTKLEEKSSNSTTELTQAETQPTEAEETPSNSETQPTEAEQTPTDSESESTEAEQTPTDSETQPTEAEETPTNSESESTESGETPSNSETEPSSPAPAPIEDRRTPTEKLDPSANPLLFPTQSDEVKIETPQALTLEQAIELSRRNNRDLQLAELNLRRAQEQLKEALGAQYPTLSTQLDFTRDDSASSELSVERAEEQNQSLINNDTITTSLNGTISANYDIYTGGRRGAQIKASQQQVQFNKLEVERLSEETSFNATNAYYALQNADAQVEIQQAAVADASQSLRDAQLLEKAGLGTRFDVLQAEVQVANANQELTTAISDQFTARRQLVQLLGLGQKVEVTAADPIEVAGEWTPTLEETIVQAYKNRAELEQFLVQRNIDEQQQLIELAAIRPQVSVFANYNVLEVFDDDLGPADGFQLGARVQWNFFDGGIARARRNQNRIDVEIAETNFARQREQVRLDVERAYFALQANQKNIETARKGLELAKESLRLARLRFQAGLGTQTDVIQAQSDLTTARGNLLSAIITYNQQLAALRRAVSNYPDNTLFDLP